MIRPRPPAVLQVLYATMLGFSLASTVRLKPTKLLYMTIGTPGIELIMPLSTAEAFR